MKTKVTRNLLLILLLDALLLLGSFYLSHLIRFDFNPPDWAMMRFRQFLPVVVVLKLVCFYWLGLYKGMWRYTGMADLINVIKAATVASLGLIVFVLYKTRFDMVSRSVFVIDWGLTLMLIIGVRVFIRLCFENFTREFRISDLRQIVSSIFGKKNKKGRAMLIIGAGDCGEKICRQFRENPSVQSHVAGFLDDDKSKTGRRIHGVPVLGTIDDIETIAPGMGIEDVIIAIPSAGSGRMRQIVDLCKKADVNFKIIPDMGELIDGRIDISAIRNVEYRDLLGREPVQLDKEKIGKYLNQRTVLVTGAGGSIGTGLCRQICRFSPKKIILLERAESPLYEIDLELKKNFTRVEVVPMLADIQDKMELAGIFSRFQPEIVFHAAAYKHVPMLENHPWKAVENNIFGTRNLVAAARDSGCKRFVFVSTDKAVNPTNVMGTSKRICELLVQKENVLADAGTRFMTVRFGNVIGSVGSVIPLFKKQIQEGGPVTVTHPDMIRYFMLIPEACQLILQAGAMGKGGEIFILEMGEPVKIDQMARDLIRFSGFEPEADIKIVYTGLRPGEKLYEELMTDLEGVIPTNHQKIRVLNSHTGDVSLLNSRLQELKIAAENRDPDQIRKVLHQIVPEYHETTV
ncbi:polysaccharide biosynthesis protein [Desulfotignum phosphitoxidans]|jgi:FlaA1/EpsC-like NDP-sugar epimerase|uniref:Capsular polysaccharide biosynthesis protein CapD n=2 Tax=Desulfotignum TaxID=115780 RepID=S0FZF6_9BACT|nr:nucleoside-diphosphate sugar epimerase/dehydratase [Desulfotignum phosphitoxidans]EMS80518.1 capsular polysaccharide biosynthesis protein CapD [Desulfotignum phosphitoxidans DSM 13687]